MQTGLPIIDQLFSSPERVIYFLVAVVIGLTVHEFAHAWVASRQGDQTARSEGRVSLNPLAHLDALGSLMFLVAGIGWAKPVPVNPYNLKQGRLGDFYVSIAGIVSNLILAFLFAIPFKIVQFTGGDSTLLSGPAIEFAAIMISVNCLLAAFNLLPFPPLDGSKAIGILVPRQFERSYQRYLAVGPMVLIALLMLDLILPINLFGTLIEPLRVLFQYLTVSFPAGLL